MKNKKKLLALVLSLVILIGGASVLYTKLAKREEEKGNSNQLLTTSGSNTWVGETVKVEEDESKPQTSESKVEEVKDNTSQTKQEETKDNSSETKPQTSSSETTSQNTQSNQTEKPQASQVTSSQSKPQQEPESQPESTPQKPTRSEPKAYDFTVYDASGKAVKLSEYIGKPIVLNFWASWCGPCGREMPDFNKKYLEQGDKVQFLMVNLTTGRETVATAQKFVSQNGYSFPVLYDKDESAANAYSVYSIPSTFFIDAEGYIMAKATGAISADVLQQGIDMIK